MYLVIKEDGKSIPSDGVIEVEVCYYCQCIVAKDGANITRHSDVCNPRPEYDGD